LAFLLVNLAASDFAICGASFEKDKRFLLTKEIAEVVDPLSGGKQ
jgi:hypothetical protein